MAWELSLRADWVKNKVRQVSEGMRWSRTEGVGEGSQRVGLERVTHLDGDGLSVCVRLSCSEIFLLHETLTEVLVIIGPHGVYL